jgi:serine/threonine-protein kinase
VADPDDRDAGSDAPFGFSQDTATEDARAAEAGRTIGAYQVLRLLGSGGMGDVFLALDGRLGRRVAIKQIRSDVPISRRAHERLRREAAAAAALSHPAIVSVYDILSDESGDSIVMEYVEGETLHTVRERGPLPVPSVLSVGRQVAEGLAAAHAAGLLHRDLKTGNVMLSPSGQAKILDFGLVKRQAPGADETLPKDESLTAEGSLIGTLPSMSPEQARGEPLDARSDLFSLGVLLYELCTGRAPFKAATPEMTLARILSESAVSVATLNPDIPDPLATLVGQLLEKEPGRRPASAEEVADRLREMEGGGAGPPRRQASARGRTVALVTAAALVAVATVAGMLWRRGRIVPSVVVLVPEAVVHSGEGQAAEREAAFVVREAVVRALTELDGVEAVGPDDGTSGLGLAQAARAMGATEVLVPTLDCQPSSCRVSLRRQDATSARVTSSSQAFEVSSDPDDALAVAGAVTLRVREVFGDHPLRDASGALGIRPADFERFMAFRRRVSSGKVLSAADVDALETLAGTSPGLSEARLLAASSARALRDRDRTLKVLDAAGPASKNDPRFVAERFQTELEMGSIRDAERALADLEAQAPGDARVTRGHARLLLRQGRSAEAAEAYRRLLRERPSWRNLWSVANIEIELGDAANARAHLTRLLEISPNNRRGRAKLAELEWTLGDPAEASRIYELLLREQETPDYATNLGWSRLLEGNYAGAADASERALELRPSILQARMILGIAREAQGDPAAARSAYRAVLDALTAAETTGPLDTTQRLLKAESLARLGQKVPAVEITIAVQDEGERSPDQIFQAALIFALAGDTSHAIVQARRARERLSPSWFRIPGFESVRDDPAFRALLAPGSLKVRASDP